MCRWISFASLLLLLTGIGGAAWGALIVQPQDTGVVFDSGRTVLWQPNQNLEFVQPHRKEVFVRKVLWGPVLWEARPGYSLRPRDEVLVYLKPGAVIFVPPTGRTPMLTFGLPLDQLAYYRLFTDRLIMDGTETILTRFVVYAVNGQSREFIHQYQPKIDQAKFGRAEELPALSLYQLNERFDRVFREGELLFVRDFNGKYIWESQTKGRSEGLQIPELLSAGDWTIDDRIYLKPAGTVSVQYHKNPPARPRGQRPSNLGIFRTIPESAISEAVVALPPPAADRQDAAQANQSISTAATGPSKVLNHILNGEMEAAATAFEEEWLAAGERLRQGDTNEGKPCPSKL